MQKYRVLSFIIVHLLIFFHVLWAKNSFLGSFDFQEFFDRFLGEGVLNAGSLMVIFAFFFTLLFGRFFCGWLCPFGAMQELLAKFAKFIKVKQIEISHRGHQILWPVKYFILAGLIGTAFYSLASLNIATELEPFKTAISTESVACPLN